MSESIDPNPSDQQEAVPPASENPRETMADINSSPLGDGGPNPPIAGDPGSENDTVLVQAERLTAAGLSVIPILADGTKAPAVKWRAYQDKMANAQTLRGWFCNGNGIKNGLAIVTGAVSGKLEVLDFDDPETFPIWRNLVESQNGGAELLERLPMVLTPSSGMHVYYRCPDGIDGNQKLARRDNGVLIETRGEGGYVLAPGSPLACHPTKQPYTLVQGDLGAVPTITGDERALLLESARALNEYVQPSKIVPKSSKEGKGVRPGDLFNEQAKWADVLTPHGWVEAGNNGNVCYWRRPGKEIGISATSGFGGKDLLYVFSTNAPPFEAEKAYSKFAAYSLLNHDGDFSSAAKELRRQGHAAQEASATIDHHGFQMRDSGLYHVDLDPEKPPTWICDRFEVLTQTRDSRSESWGKLLRWVDQDGVEHTYTMPATTLAGSGAELITRLLDGGLNVAAGIKQRNLLLQYLLQCKPETRTRCTTRVGWYGDSFVLPDTTIGQVDEEVIFQSGSETLLHQARTLEEWKNTVGKYCVGNSRLVFAASAALAGPVLVLCGEQSGGFHFVGSSSTGKTTALLVAGSVLGGGGEIGFCQTWRATANSLESVAEGHNDLTLILDELSQSEPKEAEHVAYLLANGQGKSRMNAEGALRRKLTWRLLFLSSGEVSLGVHLAAIGRKTRGGQEVRLLNIPADANAGMGIFEELHDSESPDAFARKLQDATKLTYGTPIRHFLEHLVKDRDLARDWVPFHTQRFITANVPPGSSGEVSRAAGRFALVGAAGEIAIDAGVLPWPQGSAIEAAKRLFEEWLANRGTQGAADIEAAVRQVRKFIEQYGESRFENIDDDDHDGDNSDDDGDRHHKAKRMVIYRAGYVREIDGQKQFLFLPEVFKTEVCSGYDVRQVAQALADRGFLLTDNEGRLTSRCRIGSPEGQDGDNRKRVYIVLEAILE